MPDSTLVVDEPERLWRLSSGMMVVAWLVGSGAAYFAVFPIIRAHVFNPAAFRLLWVPSIFNLVAQLGNLSGWLWHPGFLAYLFGLFVYIYSAGLMFVFIVLYRPAANSEP